MRRPCRPEASVSPLSLPAGRRSQPARSSNPAATQIDHHHRPKFWSPDWRGQLSLFGGRPPSARLDQIGAIAATRARLHFKHNDLLSSGSGRKRLPSIVPPLGDLQASRPLGRLVVAAGGRCPSGRFVPPPSQQAGRLGASRPARAVARSPAIRPDLNLGPESAPRDCAERADRNSGSRRAPPPRLAHFESRITDRKFNLVV
jgi:hypothetical protein